MDVEIGDKFTFKKEGRIVARDLVYKEKNGKFEISNDAGACAGPDKSFDDIIAGFTPKYDIFKQDGDNLVKCSVRYRVIRD